MTANTLRTFCHNELLDLLHDCANRLAMAYQDIPEKSLHTTSVKAYLAYDHLLALIQKENPSQTIH